MDELKEKVAKLCHDQWSHWMEYLFSKCYPDVDQFDKENGNLIIPEKFVERWKRQMNTSYDKLSDEEKNSDRREADKFIKLFEQELKKCIE